MRFWNYRMNSDDWVRINKKKIARELLQSLHYAAHENPAGIFTAGLPGSGKTEFTTELVNELSTKPVRLDMDEFAAMIEGYRPQVANAFRKGASSILNEVYKKVLREHIDFVFDGTLAHGRAPTPLGQRAQQQEQRKDEQQIEHFVFLVPP